MGCSALERFGLCVGADQAGDDNSRGHCEVFAREINRLDWLFAPQLLNLEWMAIKTGQRKAQDCHGVQTRLTEEVGSRVAAGA